MFRRMRRLRTTPVLRDAVAEVRLSLDDLIYPVFVKEGLIGREPIPSMPGIDRFSVEELAKEAQLLWNLGVNKLLLFGIPEEKDAMGSGAYAEDGIIQQACRALKQAVPEMLLITDVCMCEYTDHGHCGILLDNGYVDNDQTVSYLSQIAVSYARAGADVIAPSDMMDGRVGAIRMALDAADFVTVPIMAYSAKYASSFYGPFRDAADSAPSFGDRKQYQMDVRNTDQAMQEIADDIAEGADMIIVKPAMAFLDIVRRARESFQVPVVTYNVSGEYSMLKLAIVQGLLSETVIEETLLSMKRAGAKLIITYFAKELALRAKDGSFKF